MVDFALVGTLSGPGPPNPDLARFRIKIKNGFFNNSLDVCKKNCISVQMRVKVPRLINPWDNPK